MATTSPTGHHTIEHDGKVYDFFLNHWKVSQAEQLLGSGLLNFPGGQITYDLAVGFAILHGQHGINSQQDVARFFDEGPSELIDDAIAWAIVDFFRQYPALAKGLEQVLKALQAKAAKVAPKSKAKATKS